MTFDRYRVNLRALNSLTKYPAISTYHELDPRNGGLLEIPINFDRNIIGTEKVDGTNSRIILLPDGSYLLGSREELLYASGDLIGNPALGIVENLRPTADQLPPLDTSAHVHRWPAAADGLNAAVVFYLELFGGKIGGQAKQYSTQGSLGWRLFDVAHIDQLDERLTWPAERISAWRDGGGQKFADEQELTDEAKTTGFELTPRLFSIDSSSLPTSIQEMHAFLSEELPGTRVALDDSAQGRAEGIVLRTPDRSVIAKARFQDYERTLKRKANR